MWWCLVAGLLSMGAQSHQSLRAASPYGNIVGFNVFRLKPPESRTVEAPTPPRAKFRLVGITVLRGHKLALLKVQVAGNGSGPAQELSPTLGVGQREGDIEVLAIDEQAGSVEVNGFGTRAVLMFEPDGSPGSPGTTPAPSPLRAMSSVRLR